MFTEKRFHSSIPIFYGVPITAHQLALVIQNNPSLLDDIIGLASAEIDSLSDDKIYGPDPRGRLKDLDSVEHDRMVFDYGMRVGIEQELYGQFIARKLPIDGLEHELNIKLIMMGVGYDVGYSDELKRLAVVSPIDPMADAYLDVDTGDFEKDHQPKIDYKHLF